MLRMLDPSYVETRRSFLSKWTKLMIPAMMGSAGGAYGYGATWERHRLSVERHDLMVDLGKKAPKKLRIVSLTDLHFDPLYEEAYVEECVRQVNLLKPDLVVFTGDFISSTSRRINDLAQILGKIQSTAGSVACLGNHDFWDKPLQICRALEKEGVGVLINQHTRVPVNGGEVVVAGLQSVWGGRPNWQQTAHGLTPDDRVLMLMHEPDYADVLCQDERIVLQCSGHTHGGQVRLPGYGAIILPSYGRRYEAGFYGVKKMRLYVNRGIGTVDKHIRFFCPPEITCFDVVNTAVS